MQKYFGVVCVALGVGLALACTSTQTPQPLVIRECPTHGLVDGRDRLLVPLVDAGPNAGHSRIAEFNDCQRLVEGGQYGPLVAIYSNPGSDTLPQSLGGQRVATVLAVVLNVDGGSYKPLHITDRVMGYHCLYAHLDEDIVRAWMVPEDDCTEPQGRPISELPDTWLLEGRVVRPERADAEEDYPQAARWDIAIDGRIGIALKCAPYAYCEIYPQGAGKMVAAMGTAASNHPLSIVSEVKPWYDQQYLAIDQTDKGGRPGAVTGVLVPHDSLGDYTVNTFQHSEGETWTVSAWAYLDESVEKYELGFNWSKTGLGQLDKVTGNEIALCAGTRDECDIPTEDPVDCKRWHRALDDLWFARITNPDGVVAYRCVDRQDHTGLNFEIPGLVRFRWAVDDEKAWIRCGVGCCSVEP
jgi:hypothetical protein